MLLHILEALFATNDAPMQTILKPALNRIQRQITEHQTMAFDTVASIKTTDFRLCFGPKDGAVIAASP